MKKTIKSSKVKEAIDKTNKQSYSSTRRVKPPTAHLAPYQFKKGQSGNPEGRKPGKSLKEYAKEMLASMTEEERQEYMEGIDKRIIWEMAEGKAMAEVGGKDGGAIIVKLTSFTEDGDTDTSQSAAE